MYNSSCFFIVDITAIQLFQEFLTVSVLRFSDDRYVYSPVTRAGLRRQYAIKRVTHYSDPPPVFVLKLIVVVPNPARDSIIHVFDVEILELLLDHFGR